MDYKKRFPALRNKIRSSTRKRIECDIYNHALHIFVIHIAERSPLEVNLPGSVIDDVIYRLKLPRNFSSNDLVSKFSSCNIIFDCFSESFINHIPWSSHAGFR